MALTFLTDTDLKSYMFASLLTDSINDFAGTDAEIEKNNISLIRSKIGRRWDCDVIFAKTAGDRNALIVKILTILFLYDLVRRNAARKVPDDFREDWKWAMKWLDDVRDAKEVPIDLPALSDENPNILTPVLFGNNKTEDYFL